MSRSPPNHSPLGHAEASSSRASNGKQPAVEDDYSDEDALLADDPLERDLPEQ
jgi:chloride channel 3/4/5